MAFLFSTDRFASDKSAVTRVIEILKTKRRITSHPQLFHFKGGDELVLKIYHHHRVSYRPWECDRQNPQEQLCGSCCRVTVHWAVHRATHTQQHPPAIESVLQEVKQGFLHHVRHLGETEEKEETLSPTLMDDTSPLPPTIQTWSQSINAAILRIWTRTICAIEIRGWSRGPARYMHSLNYKVSQHFYIFK